MQVVEARDRLAGKADDDVALLETGAARGPAALDRGGLHRAVALEPVVPHHAPWQQDVLPREPQPRAPHAPVLE
ncbi:hypothetical protein D3C83_04530 [compost metagenome]